MLANDSIENIDKEQIQYHAMLRGCHEGSPLSVNSQMKDIPTEGVLTNRPLQSSKPVKLTLQKLYALNEIENIQIMLLLKKPIKRKTREIKVKIHNLTGNCSLSSHM